MFIKRISVLAVIFSTLAFGARAAGNDFQIAAQLLRAARSGDIMMVERLVNGGANVNYIDSTGLSIVCTAIMNNDLKAAQILQVYGADASRCDVQIRRYKDGLPKESSGGLLSGLSNAQNMTLAVGGAALVVGGLLLVGDDLFGGGGNRNGGTGGSGNRPISPGTPGDSNAGASPSWAAIAFGPAQCSNFDDPNAWGKCTSTIPNISFDLNHRMNFFSGTSPNDLDFSYMSAGGRQNYLLMMGGYAAFARGYFGQIIPRADDNLPIKIKDGTAAVLRSPVRVALVTANGINPVGSADANKKSIVCKTYEGNNCTKTEEEPIYLNGTPEEEKDADKHDFSGAGSVFNSNAAAHDTLLAQMIVGNHSGGDFVGFMPNGQLVLYRTGGGKELTNMVGVYDAANKTITTTADGYVFEWEMKPDGKSFSIKSNDVPWEFDGYIGTDGYYYVNINGNYVPYALSNGGFWEMIDRPYRNFEAMLHAVSNNRSGTTLVTQIIANAAIPINMKDGSVPMVGSVGNDIVLLSLIDHYYYGKPLDIGVGWTPSNDSASKFFSALSSNISSSQRSLAIFSAGEYKCQNVATGSTGKACLDTTLSATFENAAPVVFPTLNQYFMTAVAVQYSKGTENVTDASGVPNGGKYELSAYMIGDELFMSRSCGMAGLGLGKDIDPWCFASAGVTGEQAVATLSGAAGVLKSAFNYMDMNQIFALMALTSDGKYYSPSDLYKMYSIPADILRDEGLTPDAIPTTDAEWKSWKAAFAKTFGYGLVNLNRATRPGEKLYFYSGNSAKNGYWSGTDANNRFSTIFMPSVVLGGGRSSVSTPMFDFIESADGESMPRVFDYEFSFGGQQHGANLQRMLNEISFDDEKKSENVSLQLSDDGRDIKNLQVGLESGGFSFGAGYKQNFPTMFSNENPIMSLAGTAFSATAGFEGLRVSAFAGSVTAEGLLENDPALSDEFKPARLGNVWGVDSSVKFGAVKLGAGYMEEQSTVLGSYSGGLFSLGGGKTAYANAELKLWKFRANCTVARTETDPGYGFIENATDLYSNAYGVGAQFGKWSFDISRPLAVTRGSLTYMHTDYEIVESDNGYDLAADPHLRTIDLSPADRETRFSVLYSPTISDRTNLAFGVMRRVNPDNTKGFENLLLMKFKRAW